MISNRLPDRSPRNAPSGPRAPWRRPGGRIGAGSALGIQRVTAPREIPPPTPTVVAVVNDSPPSVSDTIEVSHQTEEDEPPDEPSQIEAAPSRSTEAEMARPRRRDDDAPSRSEHTPRTSTLAEERVGLEIARTAIGRGEHVHALEALAAHEREFPRSRVAEEREVLFVRALAGSGRRDEARRRAARFREQYPESLFLPALAGIDE